MLLDWIERGGPPIARLPQRKDFGTQLARMSVRGRQGGQVRKARPPEDVGARLRASRERRKA